MIIKSLRTRNDRTVPSRARMWSGAGALTVTGLLFLLAAGMLRGQSVTAVLVGTVTDQSGAAVPGAAVSVTMIGTNAKRMALRGCLKSLRPLLRTEHHKSGDPTDAG
jgi:hypothetical protein